MKINMKISVGIKFLMVCIFFVTLLIPTTMSMQTVEVFDGQPMTIAVTGAPTSTLTIIAPNGGENWQSGSTKLILWNWTGSFWPYVKIELLKGGLLKSTIISNTSNDGSHSWVIPSIQTPGTDYKIRITGAGTSTYTATSKNNFTISSPTPSITVVSPNGGESWVRGTAKTITWTSSGSPGTNVKIELLKGGVLNRTINSSTSNDGSLSWTIPTTQTLGSNYKVRITSTSNAIYTDTSNTNFTISSSTPSITVVSPNGGDSWVRGTAKTITWTSSGSPGTNVKIELLKGGVLNRTINSSTPNDGSHSWTIPTTQTLGSNYKVRITSTSNAIYTDTSNNNFTISSSTPSITVVSPNGGDSWVRGTAKTITWTSSGSPGTNVKIELLKGGVLNRTINSSTPNDGSHSWTIPTTQATGSNYKVRVTSTTNAAYTDSSNANFTISSSTPSITVVSPNGGQSWQRGTAKTITWTSSGSPGSLVKIELLKGGVLNRTINSSTPNDGSHSWTIPTTQATGSNYKVRVTSKTNSAYTDTSNNNFTISSSTPSITVVSPNGGQSWQRGTAKTITWTSSGSPGTNVKIELLKGGVLNRTINSSTPNDGSHSWTIPTTQATGSNYKVRVTSKTNSAYTDTSNNNFTIII